MQGFILTANTAAKKFNFISRLDVNFLDSTQNFDSQWSVKSRSRALGQCAFLKCVSRVITMQVSFSQLSLLQSKHLNINCGQTDGQTNERKNEWKES